MCVACSINYIDTVVNLAAEAQDVMISNPLSFRKNNVVRFLYLCTHDLFVVDVKCTSHFSVHYSPVYIVESCTGKTSVTFPVSTVHV